MMSLIFDSYLHDSFLNKFDKYVSIAESQILKLV